GPDLPHRPLGHPVGPVARPGVVENVAQPQHNIRFEGESEIDGRLERLLEITLPLVGAFGRGARVVLPPEVGVAQRYDLGHGPTPFRSNRTTPPNDMLVTLHRGYDSEGAG